MVDSKLNLGTPLGEPRVHNVVPAIVGPRGYLTICHWYRAEEEVPGVKRGDWLLGDLVTEEEATHYMIHELTIVLAEDLPQNLRKH